MPALIGQAGQKTLSCFFHYYMLLSKGLILGSPAKATANPRITIKAPTMMSLIVMLVISRYPQKKGEKTSQMPKIAWNTIQYRKLPMLFHFLLVLTFFILLTPSILVKPFSVTKRNLSPRPITPISLQYIRQMALI